MKIPFYNASIIEAVKEKISVEKNNGLITTAIIIDVETLGTMPTAVVFNLAALFFSINPEKQTIVEEEVPDNFLEFRFDPIEQLVTGRTIDASTVAWWRSPNKRTALETISALPITPFSEGMGQLYQWVREKKEKHQCRVFYRGMDFDGPIIDSLYESAGIKTEWRRGDAARDIRSFIDAKLGTSTGYVMGIPKEESQISHTALGDCFNDARAMQLAYCLNKVMTKDGV